MPHVWVRYRVFSPPRCKLCGAIKRGKTDMLHCPPWPKKAKPGNDAARKSAPRARTR